MLLSHGNPALDRLKQWFDGTGPAPRFLVLGDSVLERTARDDADKTLLGEMLRDELKGIGRVECLSGSGYHMGVYLRFLRAVTAMKDRPEWVVLPVNLRSFSPTWYQNPLWSFSGEEGEPISLSEKDASFEAFDATPAHLPQSSLKTLGEFRKMVQAKPEQASAQRARFAEIFRFHYLYPIEQSHPLLEALARIVRLLESEQISLFLYLNPTNFEAGIRYLGEAFSLRMNENKQTILAALKKAAYPAPLRDYTAHFGSEHFFTPENATEHLREGARGELAGKIAAELRAVL